MFDRGLTLDLHAYQCHVFLDWRELRSTAEQPWDRLCDKLNGRGVPNLDDAMISWQLRPVHEELSHLLEPTLIRLLAELGERQPAGPEQIKKHELRREEFEEIAWRRTRELLGQAHRFYRSHPERAVAGEFINPAYFEKNFIERGRAVMRLPALEALFPEPWPAAARRVLPSYSPSMMATALWAPVFAWSMLELVAASVSRTDPERAALDLFDRLRLREPLGHAFQALGFAAEESWRVAARIKVALLIESGAFAAPGVIPYRSPAFWQDPDVRWLTGTHEAEGEEYFIKERFEELLWWLQLPSLCRLAAQERVDRVELAPIIEALDEADAAAAEVSYRVAGLCGEAEAATETPAVEVELEAEPKPEPVAEVTAPRENRPEKKD